MREDKVWREDVQRYDPGAGKHEWHKYFIALRVVKIIRIPSKIMTSGYQFYYCCYQAFAIISGHCNPRTVGECLQV